MRKIYSCILIMMFLFFSTIIVYSDYGGNEVSRTDFGEYTYGDNGKKIGLVFRATATSARPGATVRYRTNGVNIDIYKDHSTYLGRKFVSFEDWHSITQGPLVKDIQLNEIIESPTITQNHQLINDLKNVFDNHDTLLILNAQIEVFRTNAQGGYSQRITLANTLQEAINAAPWGQETIEDFKTRYDQKRDFQALKKVPYSITKTYWGVNESGAVKIKNDFVWKDTIHEDELPKILELCVLEHSVPSNISFNGINFTFESNNVSTNAGGIYNTQTEIEDKKREIILTENSLHHWVRYKYIATGNTPITGDTPNDPLPQSEAQGTIIFTPYSSEWVKGIDVLISLAEDAVTTVEASNSIERNYNYRYINDDGEDDTGTSSVLRAYTQTWEAGEIKVEGQNKLNNENKSMTLNSDRKVNIGNDGMENQILEELKHYDFREYKRLFILDDVEKIMHLLTDNLKSLKKLSQVYYSEDFKKLHVKNIDSLGLSLSDDGSLIYMNINLENVSDEELAELLECIKSGKKYYRLKNGSIINLESVESSKFIDLINSLDIDEKDINNGIFEVPLNRCIYIDNYLKEKGIENVKMESRLENLINGLSDNQEIEIDLDDNLKGVLRNYQIVGIKWIKSLSRYSFGGILADDMGLGKTLQVLAFISSEKDRKLPCMVVAPTSIVYNWKVEANKFTPKLKVLLISGVKDKRDLMILCCNEYDIIVTSYGALKNDVESYKKVQFSYVFIDEAQNIKNPMTLNANSVKSLKAKCCFALTGTPIENRLMEVWSIFDFVMPGYLYSKNKFSHNFENPILKDKNQEKIDELSRLIKPFSIRRLKKDVLDELPQKINTNFFREMTKEQKKLYVAYYKKFKKELEEEGFERNQIGIFKALTRLRQICAHPATFIKDYDGGSGKLDMAIELIDESINSGHSILLFSQFTKMLKIIRDELECRNINYYYLDGTMSPEDRKVEIFVN